MRRVVCTEGCKSGFMEMGKGWQTHTFDYVITNEVREQVKSLRCPFRTRWGAFGCRWVWRGAYSKSARWRGPCWFAGRTSNQTLLNSSSNNAGRRFDILSRTHSAAKHFKRSFPGLSCVVNCGDLRRRLIECSLFAWCPSPSKNTSSEIRDKARIRACDACSCLDF